MRLTPMIRGLAAGAIATFVAGCGSGSTPSVTTAQNSHTLSIQHGVPMRALPGPAVTGVLMVPAMVPNEGPGYMAAGVTKKVFVADIQHNQVLIFNAVTGKQIGKITQSVNAPVGLAIDTKGTLYVSNLGNTTITEYPLGKFKPSFTITSGLSSNYGIAVDSKGNVFASNLGNNTVTGFHPGKNAAFETITINGQPVGMGEDSNDTLYVASDSTNQVFIVKTGTKIPKPLSLSGLSGPICVTIGAKDDVYVSDFASNVVTVYPAGKSTPSETITNGINQPTFNGIVEGQLFFQSDQTGPVNGYKGTATSPYVTISGITQPMGIAGWPRQPQ